MRNIVLGLLLANLLLLAWYAWIVPPDVEFPAADDSRTEPELVLVERENRPAGQADSVADRQISLAPGGQCVRLGPFAEEQAADTVRRQLVERDLDVTRSSQDGEIWLGHWVQLLNLGTREKALKAVERLSGAGLVDAYIVQSSPTYNISLGVFRNRELADNVSGLAAGLGLNPVMTDRFRSGTEYWLTVELQGVPALALGDIQLETSQILRTEVVACPAEDVIPGVVE